MKLLAILVTFAAVTISFVFGQGWQFNPYFNGQNPPGLHFNPVFNGQNPPGSQFNPVFNGHNPPGSQFNPVFNGQNPPGSQFNPVFNGQNPPGSFNPVFNGQHPPGLNPVFNGQNPPPGLQYNPFYNGQNPPPGLQFNPFFNGQNPNSNIPGRNSTSYHPFFNNFPSSNNSNPYSNFWNRDPFFSRFSAGRGLSERVFGAPQYYSPHYCIPDHPQCNGSHSISVGCLSPWDKALFRQSYVKPGKWFWKREKTICYPRDFLPPGVVRNETITAVKIQDRNCNGTGGYAEILPGTGVGYRTVCVKMYSTGAGKGFNFYCQFFGR